MRILSSKVYQRLAQEGVEIERQEVTPDKGLKCSECGFIAQDEHGLNEHIKKHDEVEEIEDEEETNLEEEMEEDVQ